MRTPPLRLRQTATRFGLAHLPGVASHLSGTIVFAGVVAATVIGTKPTDDLIDRAERRIERMLGGAYAVEVGNAAWSLSKGDLSLLVEDARVSGHHGGAVEIDRLSMTAKSRSLDVTSWSVGGIDVGRVTLYRAPSRGGTMLSADAAETFLRGTLRDLPRRLRSFGVERIAVERVELVRPEAGRHSIATGVTIERRDRADFDVSASLTSGAGSLPLSAALRSSDDGSLLVETRPLPLSALFERRSFSTDAPLKVTVIVPPTDAHPIVLDAAVNGAPITLGRHAFAHDGGGVTMTLDDGRLSIPSFGVRFGESEIAGRGSLALTDGTTAPAIAFALTTNDLTIAPADMEHAARGEARIAGRFEIGSRLLDLTDIDLSTNGGRVVGQAAFRFVDPSPEIAVDLKAGEFDARQLTALWPSWIGRDGRDWAARNLRGGSVSGLALKTRLAAGRLHEARDRKLLLEPDEFSVRGLFSDAEIMLFGDLPPLAGASGELAMSGRRLEVAVDAARLQQPGEGDVSLRGSWLTIPDLMAPDMPLGFDLAIAGPTSALARIGNARPFAAMDRTPFAAGDLTGEASGRIRGNVTARSGAERDWLVELDLANVDLVTPIEGRSVGGLDGTLVVSPTRAYADLEGKLDGIVGRFVLNEPFAPVDKAERLRAMEMTLRGEEIDRFAPGLSRFIGGTVRATARVLDGAITIDADLTAATLDLPQLGWRKAAGIAGRASFVIDAEGDVKRIEDIVVAGDGFGARGRATVDAKGARSVRLSSVRLAPGDDFGISVDRTPSGHTVQVEGSSLDARSIVDRLAQLDGAKPSSAESDVAVTARLSRVQGHGRAALSDLVLDLDRSGGRWSMALRAAIGAGASIAIDGSGDGTDDTVFATSGDFGTTLRFMNIYKRMRGGVVTANAARTEAGGEAWAGFLDASGIELIEEPKLASLASRTKRGRSDKIDANRVRFSRAFGDFTFGEGTLTLSDTVFRGPQIGATLAGVVKSPDDRLNVAGTFLPAYGLNRVFAEVPIIGELLGNGSDKGLLGLTFRLSGTTRAPSLEVNPLSIIAPGLFRSVFEYEP